MHIRLGRAGKVAALGAALTVIGGGVCSAQSRAHNENSLLGITLLKSSYRDVLKRFGRPDEIQAGGPYMPSLGNPSAGQAGGGGGGQRGISRSGFPGGGGTGATMPGGGGYPGAMGRGGYPGAGGAPGGMGGGSPYGGGGLPGFGYPGSGGGSPYGGAPGGMGAGPGMGLPGGEDSGAAGAGGSAEANAAEAQDEATWWYHDRANGLHKSFLFNKDGRVIQVQEYGFDKKHKGGKTRAGVGLGSGLNQVLRTYGWSNDGANAGRNVILRYGGDEKVAFQFVNNVVVGITVAVVKEPTPTEESQ